MVVTVNPVQEPVTVQAMAAQEPIQATTVQTPVTVQTTPANASPPSSILRSPPPQWKHLRQQGSENVL